MGEESVDITTEKTLRYLGILTALKGFPGQFAVAVWSIALAEAVYLSLGIPAELIPSSNQQVIVVVIGAIVGVIAYTAGNFWDRVVFKRLYGLEGSRSAQLQGTRYPLQGEPASLR